MRTVNGNADRCPGVLRAHHAADGALVRLRTPGGIVSTEAMTSLTRASARYADGCIGLTSRGNLQLRGIALDEGEEVPHGLVETAMEAGFLPSTTHERVRNIVASPLTGRVGGIADLRPVVRDLDERLCATPALAALPGRFCFGLDDGRGDVAAMHHDVGVRAVDAGSARIVVGPALTGPLVRIGDAGTRLVALAERFAAVRGDAWRVDELPEQGAELAAVPGEDAPTADERAAPAGTSSSPMPYGAVPQADGRIAVSALVPLGRLTPEQSEALASATDGSGELVITPWRGVVAPDVEASRAPAVVESLTAAGLVLDERSAWNGLTACTGAPGCLEATTDTRATAARIAAGPRRELPTHVVACARACGRPAGPHHLVLTAEDR